VDRQIAEIDSGKWQPGPLAEPVPAKVKVVSPPQFVPMPSPAKPAYSQLSTTFLEPIVSKPSR
jgi:hypothetical protein